LARSPSPVLVANDAFDRWSRRPIWDVKVDRQLIVFDWPIIGKWVVH
jgi:hypothetical protein